MAPVEIIGVAATVVTSTMAVPQLWRLMRGATGSGVAPSTWWMAFCAGVVWICHNVASAEWSAVIANAFAAACAAAILFRHYSLDRRSRQHARALLVPTTVAVVALVAVTTGWVSLGWIAGSLGLLRFLPQAFGVLLQRNSPGVSSLTWVLAGTANLLWAMYGWLHGDPTVVAPALVAAPLAGLIALRVMLQRRRRLHSESGVTGETDFGPVRRRELRDPGEARGEPA